MNKILGNLSPILLFLLIPIAFITVNLFDRGLSTIEYDSGKVIDKNSTTETTTYTTGFVGSKYATLTNTTDAKYVLTVKTNKGTIISVDTDPNIYYSKQINDSVYIAQYIGGLTNANWYTDILK
jgi:hypothetical protein